MVFMADSVRAASVARHRGIEAGLHLNFVTAFTAENCPSELTRWQGSISRYLRCHRLAQVVFNPGLMKAFQYVAEAQSAEFARLYGREPNRIDGHHHMHLCANAVWQRLLPEGTLVRRNTSFFPGQKSWSNRLYRRSLDMILARRHRLTDFFFSLQPLDCVERLRRIFSLANRFSVEVAAHAVTSQEFRFLAQGEVFREFPELRLARPSELSQDRVGALRWNA